MRTHGWAGSSPATDEEAAERILDAAGEEIDQRGAQMRIADVARTLGISRQTIYNYFPGPNTLIEAVANRSGLRFRERLAEHLTGISDPIEAVVESLAYTIEWLPGDKAVQLMLAHDFGKASSGVTASQARQFGHGILAGFDVDWDGLGLDAPVMDDLVEYMLRIVQSFVVDPGDPPRRGAALRATLRRWVAPMVIATVTP